MILFKNNPAGFLGFQFLFFVAAWFIAKAQTGMGLRAWGLDKKTSLLKHLSTGLLAGMALYGVSYGISVGLGSEKIITIPSFRTALMPVLLFVFGNFFSSFSEDILTRGYVYHHSQKHVPAGWIIIVSASVYLLNHIYRLKDGPQAWIYLFLLGILFVLPLIQTKRLWFTGGMHWAGNCTFYITHEIIKTDSMPGKVNPNYIFVGCIIAFIPITYIVLKRFGFIQSVKQTYQVPQATAPLILNK